MPDFNPDEYIKSTQKATDFNPDAYLAESGIKKKTSIQDSDSGSKKSSSGLSGSQGFPTSGNKPLAPTVLTPERQEEFKETAVKPFVAKKEALSQSLNKANNAYKSVQGKKAFDELQTYIANRPEDTISEPEEQSFTESVTNTGKNIGNRLEGFIPRLKVVSADVWEKVLGKELAGKFYDLENRDLAEERRLSYMKLDQLAQETQQTQGIIGNIQNFDAPRLAAGVVDAMGSIVSTAIPAVLTGGAGLFTDMAGESIVSFNEAKAKAKGVSVEELYKKGEAEFNVPFSIGVIGGGMELLGIKGVQSAMTRNLKGSVLKRAGIMFTDVNKEGLTEWIQGGLETANIAIAEGKTGQEVAEEVSKAMLSKKGLESYVMGVVGSGGASVVGRYSKKVYDRALRKEVESLEQTQESTMKDIANPDISPDVKEELIDVLVETQSKINSAVRKDDKAHDGLSEDQKEKVQKLDDQASKLEAIINDASVSKETKAQIQNKLDTIQEKISEIVPDTEASLGKEFQEAEKTFKEYGDQTAFDNEMASIEARVQQLPDNQIKEKEVEQAETEKQLIANVSSETKKPNNIPAATNNFEAVEVKPYKEIEDNVYKPNEQLKFNQGGNFEPVRIVAEPDLIELISMGAKQNASILKGVKSTIDMVRLRELEAKFGMSAFDANKKAKEFAKANRSTTVENFVILGDKIKTQSNEQVPEIDGTTESVLPEQVEPEAAQPNVEEINEVIPTQEQINNEQEAIQEEAISNEGSDQVGRAIEGEVKQESTADGTALKNADIVEKRKELGLPERVLPETKRNEDLVSQAKEEIKNGYNVNDLMDSLDGGEKITDKGVVHLKLFQLAKENELIELNDKIVLETQEGKGTSLDKLIQERDETLNDLQRSYTLGEKAGTETARALQARKVKLLNDYSLATLLIRKRSANGGEKLSPEQINETSQKYLDIKAKNEALEAKIKELEEENIKVLSDKTFKKIKNDIEFEKRQFGRVIVRESIEKDIDETLANLKKKIKEQSQKLSANPIPIEMIPDIAKLAKLYAKKGINSLEGVIDNIYVSLKEDIEGLNKEDIRSVLVDYDYEGEAKESARLKGFKTRTEKQTNEYRERINKGQFANKARTPIKLDKEGIELRDALRKAKYDFELELERDVLAKRTPAQKAKDIATEILNTPRAIMASIDYSAPLRQAVIFTVSHPKIASKAFIEMFKQSFSQKRFDTWLADLKESPEFVTMEESKLYIADPHKPKLEAKEEQFMSNVADKVPYIGKLVKGSERAYVSYLNKIRADVFNDGVEILKKQGITIEENPETYKALAKMVNNFTGRGSLGALETSAPILNSVFFSPRLMAARLNSLNPYWYYKMPKEIRQMALKDMAKFIGFGLTVLTLASLSGADVEEDPRSTDFGKIRVGDTRWDIWGGFQQYVRFFSQLFSGQTKSTKSGKIMDLNGEKFPFKTRGDLPFTMLRSKLAPVPAMGLNLLYGKDIVGNEYGLEEIPKSFIPLVMQDSKDIMKDKGLKGVFTDFVPAVFGVGVQTYKR